MIGTVLGNRYELLEKIGEGGMAIVYRAKDHLLSRNVAVKILKEEFSSDGEFVEKFKREAAAAASLSDNNIVNIYDVGTQKDINYIVMECVIGKTLKQVIKEEKKIPPARAVEVAIQIAKALKCAHKNNIIHRDIKPHNILVTEDGIVKVTDFGIAKASDSVTITNSNKIMGSAHYFSPEQAKGSFVDFRTDIYSLGIVMYEMVTGRVPYDAESPVSIALKHIQEPVVPPNQLNENIPDSLNKLILKAVEKEPIRRYQTMEDMLVDLKKIENNQKLNLVDDDLAGDMTRIMDPVDVNNAYKNEDDYDDDYEAESPKKPAKFNLDPKKKKRILGTAIGVLVVVIGIISGYIWYNKVYSSGDIAVPSIVGMKQDDAKQLVESKKLNFVVGGKEKSDKPEGTVIECFPKVGTKVKANSDVRVIISSGSDSLTVPNLVGVDLATAKDIISNSGLTLGNVSYRHSEDVAEGDVISQDPTADSKAQNGTKVNLVVSKGADAKYVTVPDVSGKNIEEAASIMASSGLKISRNPVTTSDKSQSGVVTSQSIGGSQQVKEGTTVSLTYYEYKETQNDQSNNTNSNNGNGSKSSTDNSGSGSGGNKSDSGSKSSSSSSSGNSGSNGGTDTNSTGSSNKTN